MTSSVDVAFGVFGNGVAVGEIASRIKSPENNRDGKMYQHNLASAKQSIDLLPASFWNSSIYNLW